MDVENGVWIMRGLSQNDPGCIRSWQALMRWIDYGHISSAYSAEPERSWELIRAQVQKHLPSATEKTLRAVPGWKR